MKKYLLSAAAAVLFAGGASAQRASAPTPPAPPNAIPVAEAGLAIGSDIPMAALQLMSTDMKKGPVSLQSASTKKGLLVMFSCNTCPFVVKSEARTLEVMKAAKEAGIGAVIINSNAAFREGDDSFEAMKAYAAKQEYTVPYLMDEGSALADAFDAKRTPEVFLFNGEGQLVYKGAMEDNPANPSESTKFYLTTAMEKMLAGETITPEKTKSIGCSIKRKS